MSYTHMKPTQAGLPPDARAAFDRLRRTTARQKLAERLGVGAATVEQLEDGGRAQQRTIDRIVARLEELGELARGAA